MELRHFRYFAALAEQLNFTRAAQKVHVTQSTLSQQIKQLETEIGCRLFSRIGKQVVMTEAGEQLLPKIKRALLDIEDGIRSLQGTAPPLSGALRLGVTHTFNIGLIPDCLAVFLREHPAVRVTIRELPADTIAQAIRAGEMDLGVTYRPRNGAGLSFQPLCHDEMVLVVPAGHPFAARKRVRMAELHRQRLILYTKDSATQQFLDEWFRSAGAEPIVAVEMNACAPMPALVRRLGTPAIISRLGAPDSPDLRLVPIESPTPLRTPGILWTSVEEPAATAKSFAAIIRHAVIGADAGSPGASVRRNRRPAVRIRDERTLRLIRSA